MKATALAGMLLLLSLSMLMLAQPAQAAVQTETVQYMVGTTQCEGYFAWDDAVSGKRPAILIVHQYRGPGEYEQKRAQMLAQLGYLAFVCDIYGKAVRPASHEAGLAEVGKYYGDRALFRERLAGGLDRMLENPAADRARVAAIGYCFGGTGVLELARSGADIRGVVSFHGNLDSTMPAQPGDIKCKVLALAGAADPFVPKEQVAAFEKEMDSAGVDWYLEEYGHALHAFTMWGMDMPGMAKYDAAADKRSWRAMQDFFSEIFE
jgi:dienelactone hydrolase